MVALARKGARAQGPVLGRCWAGSAAQTFGVAPTQPPLSETIATIASHFRL
jgi:hypothetical protein